MSDTGNDQTFYSHLGGIEFINRLVDEFYLVMRTDPKAKECFATHEGRDLAESGEKLKAFLSGWLGGPQLYVEKYGHPRLRMRHMPFSVGGVESEQWLYCMSAALYRCEVPEPLARQLIKALYGVTKVIENRG